jgi:beta-lactamase class A
MRVDRRALLAGLAGLSLLPLPGCATTAGTPAPDAAAALATLETRSGGRLGIAILDGKDGTLTGHRAADRFTMCSTFKLSLAAAVLALMDAGEIAPDATLPIAASDPVGHSPVLRAALAEGKTSLPVLTLSEAAQVQSDNGASNILLRRIGGPVALTDFWRRLGDDVTRLDRYEPELNTSHDGDPRDTTSPAAMARSMRAMLTGDLLEAATRERLIGWMIGTQTGLKRLRGGFPAEWRAGDKTGTNPGDGSYAGKTNDLAIVWHPARPEPFFVTALYESVNGTETRPQDEAVLAEAGRIAAAWIAARV